MTGTSGLSGAGPVVLIGAGKMGHALAQGWLHAGLANDQLVLVDPHPQSSITNFAHEQGIRLLDKVTGEHARVLVLAVKPQMMPQVLSELRSSVGPDTLVISIAAGISIETLSGGLGTRKIVRTMPNTPAQLGRGITGAVPASGIGAADRDLADALLKAAGDVLWFEDESKIDAVTAVSGSGPAYVFHFVEALAEAARHQGFSEEQAMQLARATVIGAAALLESDGSPASVLRQNVTSPKGTTAAALDVLMGEPGLTDLIDRTVQAARARSEELGRA